MVDSLEPLVQIQKDLYIRSLMCIYWTCINGSGPLNKADARAKKGKSCTLYQYL